MMLTKSCRATFELLSEVGRFTGGAPFADDICLVAAEFPA